MTQELLNYKESELLFMDIETVREFENIDENHPKFHTFRYKMRDRNTDELPTVEETKELYNRKAALYPIYAKIVCITMGFVKDNTTYLKSFKGEEKDILTDVVTTLKSNGGKTMVYYNHVFDLPAIRQRYMINGLTDYLTDSQGNDSGKKPWSLKGSLDLMEVWKGIRFASDSLEEVCVAFQINSSKNGDVKGSEVSKVYYEGGIDKIVQYCERDVIALINIYRKFTYKEVIEEVKIVTKQKKPKLNVLQKIASDIKPSEEELAELDIRIESLEGEEKEIAKNIKKAAAYRDKPMFQN